jgi:hypothetical protein
VKPAAISEIKWRNIWDIKLNVFATNNKKKNARVLYRGRNEFKRSYKSGYNLEKMGMLTLQMLTVA